jgi:hypothetical protein
MSLERAGAAIARHVWRHHAEDGDVCARKCMNRAMSARHRSVRDEAEALAVRKRWLTRAGYSPNRAGGVTRQGLARGSVKPPRVDPDY